LVSASRVTDDKGKTIAHVASHRDITELKKEEREKAEMQKRLFRSEKLETIGILAGGIAHDFNNILTPIIGYTDMVLSRLSSHDPITEDLEEILSGANRAKDLVRQILTFSQQMEMEKKPIRLQQVVEEALKLLRPIIPSTIEILKEIDVNCPMVMADSSQIHEVIVNLCTNAYQAMADGGGQITFELKAFHSDDGDDSRSHPILQEGEYVRLTVSDTGPGMTEEIKDHIFEPFFTTKKSEKGSGLGLSVVHGIIQSNGGEITVSSEPGKGAAFHVYLPVTKEIAKPQRKQIDSFPRGHETILLIDDETSVLELLRKILNQLGYTVDARGSSVDALEAFCKQPDKYDLILTDLTMPKMTGLDLAEEIRKTHPEFPIVLLTGYGNTISENVLKKNVSTIIGKPIDIRNLAGTLRAVLDSS
jgi:signal transduction histidine kinase